MNNKNKKKPTVVGERLPLWLFAISWKASKWVIMLLALIDVGYREKLLAATNPKYKPQMIPVPHYNKKLTHQDF